MTDIRIASSLIQNQIDHIAKQMGWVMERTATSTIFSESHDFSCFLCDSSGAVVSVADGIPIHTGGGQFAVQAVLRDFGSSLSNGDVFILSDPYEAGGNHLPDWTVIRPVFFQKELFAFACNRAHQSDIGGGAAGTYNPAATEIFHEGIRLPVLKIVEKGRIRSDVWRLLLLNSRCPTQIDGDLRAMIGSTAIGGKRLIALAEEYGENIAQTCFERIQTYAETCIRKAIRGLPDGEYLGADSMDNDCFEPCTVIVRAKVVIAGDQIAVDFSGSSEKIRGFKNSSLANTYSATYMAILSFLDHSLPRNQGSFRAISINAPEGSIVNARPPAAMTMNTVHPAYEIIGAVWKALSQVVPDKACAGWGKSSHCISSGQGTDGGVFVMYHMHAYPASGAVKGRDGFSTIGQLVTMGGMTLPNVEAYEKQYPVMIRRQEFRCDTGGAGEYRGGTGIQYEVEMNATCTYNFRGEGIRTESGFGIAGGGTGAKADIEIRTRDGRERIESPQYGTRVLPPVRLRIESAAGGGWGSPNRRLVERVLRDVQDEVVSVEGARRDYGVVIDPASMLVDEEGTQRLRQHRAGDSFST